MREYYRTDYETNSDDELDNDPGVPDNPFFDASGYETASPPWTPRDEFDPRDDDYDLPQDVVRENEQAFGDDDSDDGKEVPL